jgi:hypothetical protein
MKFNFSLTLLSAALISIVVSQNSTNNTNTTASTAVPVFPYLCTSETTGLKIVRIRNF